MIKKFIKINGTGKFLNYAPNSVPAPHRTTDFEQITLIYGENGSGKTTLSTIFDSLRGNNGILRKKRSFDRSVAQEIQVLTDITPNPRLTYADNSWDANYPNIEVFNVHFINDNIYTGLEIENSHKKNLFDIIFGNDGVRLKGEIQRLKERIQQGKSQTTALSNEISSAIDRAYSLPDFIALEPDAEIDNKINAKQSEIRTANSFNEILAKSNLTPLRLPHLPYEQEASTALVAQTVSNIQQESLERFNEHKEQLHQHVHMQGKAEAWIKTGHRAIEDDTCPFCTQSLDGAVDIIEAYNQYFNEDYNALLENVARLKASVVDFNIEAQLLQIQSQINSNQSLIEYWKNHLTNRLPDLNGIMDDIEPIKIAFEAVKSLIQTKSQNPIQGLNAEPIRALQSLVDELTTKLAGHNQIISNYNQSIASLKAGDRPNTTLLQTELKRLQAIKKRQEPEIVEKCTTLTGYESALSELNANKDAKQEALDTYSATIFENYGEKINEYLRSFAPYLEIQNFSSRYVGRSSEPMVGYALHINGNEVRPDDNNIDPCFKYSLSEGDKTALALSFFLTKLELDGDIANKIIVFDDPVSSFDLNRKSTTINKLITLGQKAKQLFVFSHNLMFASEFWKRAKHAPCNTQCSRISDFGQSACISEYDIDTETLSSILKDSLQIKSFLDNGALTDEDRRGIARCLRPALESYFHLKFFDLVAENDWLGDFIGNVRDADATSRFFRLQDSLTDLTDINDYSKRYHHRFNLNSENEPVTDSELRTYCERTLALIQVI